MHILLKSPKVSEGTRTRVGLTGLDDISGVKSPYKCQEARAVVTKRDFGCLSAHAQMLFSSYLPQINFCEAILGKSQVLHMERLAYEV